MANPLMASLLSDSQRKVFEDSFKELRKQEKTRIRQVSKSLRVAWRSEEQANWDRLRELRDRNLDLYQMNEDIADFAVYLAGSREPNMRRLTMSESMAYHLIVNAIRYDKFDLHKERLSWHDKLKSLIFTLSRLEPDGPGGETQI